MSRLITTCPHCFTLFHVREEQLAISQGKVRCGKCQHVFDALTFLAEAPPTSGPPVTPITDDPKPVADLAPVDVKLATSKTKPLLPKWLLLLISALLLLSAGFQAIYFSRSSIAANWPILRPHLIAACDLLDCKVGLPQQAELLTIDDSDMKLDAEREGVIHLSATLMNNAPFTQAYPLLEITLTDAYDKPLVRRLVSPMEYLPGQAIDNGIPAGESLQLRLALTAGDSPVAGYRLFVTYSAPNENH